MELLKQLLTADELNIPNLEDEVRALGYDPANLTDDDTLNIAGKLKEKFSSKLAKNGNKKLVQPKPQPQPLEIATDKAVKEVDNIVSKYEALANKVVESKSSKIIKIIEDIPNATMARVRQLLDDSEGNLDFFLNSTEDVEAAFLAKFDID